MRKLKKINAGALQYVLVISIIIAIILLAFILLLEVQNKVDAKNYAYKEALRNVDLGFTFLTSQENANDRVNSQRFSQELEDETTFTIKNWGLYTIAIVASKIKKESFAKIGLLGGKRKKRNALYLQDNNTPLVLVGKTRIKGNVRLPVRGVQTGNIAGVSFYGSQLIQGRIANSTAKMPEIANAKAIENIQNLSFLKDHMEDFELEEDMQLTRSFELPTLVYQANGIVELKNMRLSGNVVIRASRKIIVHASASLKDLILIAPEITIKKKVQGNFQAFATKNIVVEKKALLEYPSVLSLRNVHKEKENSILIEEKVAIRGSVLYTEKNTQESFYTPQIKLSEKSKIVGEVYCHGNLELLGEVLGMVITKGFITKQKGSTYLNHIYNGTIDENALPKAYVGSYIASDKKGVIKWLY